MKHFSAVLLITTGWVLWLAGCQMHFGRHAAAQKFPPATPFVRHPASAALARLFPDRPIELPAGFKATGIRRGDYLTLVTAVVDFYKQQQDEAGAIIDPVRHAEIQYSTPAFALSAATLVVERGRSDLLIPAARAMTFATHALANLTTADKHADFYTPMLLHARQLLASRVSAPVLAGWDADLRAIVPETHYRDTAANHNWNIVNLDGESLRCALGLVATTQIAAQRAYIERSLDKQQARFTRFGMYADPNMPLAYDAFPRLWLEDMLIDGRYDGPHAQQLRDFLLLGGLSSMLMLSPNGEWPAGGRSAHHQWNEAENIAIFEYNARKWHRAGRDDIAGAMKRSAHLAYQSMLRWQRPTGELSVVKNRAEPEARFGYETYSSHSQYNLLPMAMLCLAEAQADDSIAEAPAACETGGYLFDVRETFHKVFANAGGMYIEIDTAADAHYNATGLQRVERAGVALSPLSDSTASHRMFGPTEDKNKLAMSPGLQWSLPSSADAKPANAPKWHSLAEYVNGLEPMPEKGELPVLSVALKAVGESAEEVAFSLRYQLGDSLAVQESYRVRPAEVVGSWKLLADQSRLNTRVLLPALVTDGAKALRVSTAASQLEAHRDGAVLRWQLMSPATDLHLQGPRIPSHNGLMQAAVGSLPEGTRTVSWKLTLENEKP